MSASRPNFGYSRSARRDPKAVIRSGLPGGRLRALFATTWT